jgi:hypothetical protein
MDGSDATTESIANAGVARVTIGNEAAAPFTKAALVTVLEVFKNKGGQEKKASFE